MRVWDISQVSIHQAFRLSNSPDKDWASRAIIVLRLLHDLLDLVFDTCRSSSQCLRSRTVTTEVSSSPS